MHMVFLDLMTTHITKRLLLKLYPTSLPVLTTFMPRILKGKLQISMQTSSQNVLGILPSSWDMMDPFVIPKLIDPNASSVEDRWDKRKTTGVHLLKKWGKLFLCQCKAWQQDYFDYASIVMIASVVYRIMIRLIRTKLGKPVGIYIPCSLRTRTYKSIILSYSLMTRCPSHQLSCKFCNLKNISS